MIKGSTILLQSGEYFSFTDPEDSNFGIEDIAHGLGNTCRFGGQSRKFYSVAEHCVHCSHIVPEEDRLEALLHDGSEGLGMGDMVKPLKNMNHDYEIIEARVETAIAKRFGTRFPFPPSIKIADKQMLRAEQLQVMRNNDKWEQFKDNPEVAHVKIEFWHPLEAKLKFLDRFAEIIGK